MINDEDQEKVFLRWYDMQRPGDPVESVKVRTHDPQPDKEHPEIDLEGMATVGDRLYLIASHSRNRNGKIRPGRMQLFAVDWPPIGKEASIKGKPYRTLLTDLQKALQQSADPALKALTLDNGKPPKEGGVNIEGVAGTPRGGLLIGFRSPVAGGKALVAELLNPQEVTQGQKAKFGSLQLIDLQGDGVRDVIASADGYLLLSGPVGVGGTAGLYRWNGDARVAPIKLFRSSMKELGAPEGSFPEGLQVDANGDLLLVFDEGARPAGNKELCKELADPNKRSFHVVRITHWR